MMHWATASPSPPLWQKKNIQQAFCQSINQSIAPHRPPQLKKKYENSDSLASHNVFSYLKAHQVSRKQNKTQLKIQQWSLKGKVCIRILMSDLYKNKSPLGMKIHCSWTLQCFIEREREKTNQFLYCCNKLPIKNHPSFKTICAWSSKRNSMVLN